MNLTIVKDEKDCITKVAHEIQRVLRIHREKCCVKIFGIYDHEEFDVVKDNTVVLFLLTDVTKSFEIQVPKWIRKLALSVQPKWNLKYFVVRELTENSRQVQVTNQPAYFDNEKCIKIQCDLLNVDQINHVLQWWPSVIQLMFETRTATCTINVVTHDNTFSEDVENDAQLKTKLDEITTDTILFLKRLNALENEPLCSSPCKLFVIGDAYKFYENHKHLRQEKINGCKIMLVLLRETTSLRLQTISTSQILVSNLISDILQIMIDIGIVISSKSLQNSATALLVKEASAIKMNETNIKIFWKYKSNQSATSNPGNISVQVKQSTREKWEEIIVLEVSETSCETVIANPNSEQEFRLMFEDALTGNMFSPICVKNIRLLDNKINIKKCIQFICWFSMPLFVVNVLEYGVASIAALPFLLLMHTLSSCRDGLTDFYFDCVVPLVVLCEKIMVVIVIPLYLGPYFALPTVLNLILPALVYVWFMNQNIRNRFRQRFVVTDNQVL